MARKGWAILAVQGPNHKKQLQYTMSVFKLQERTKTVQDSWFPGGRNREIGQYHKLHGYSELKPAAVRLEDETLSARLSVFAFSITHRSLKQRAYRASPHY